MFSGIFEFDDSLMNLMVYYYRSPIWFHIPLHLSQHGIQYDEMQKIISDLCVNGIAVLSNEDIKYASVSLKIKTLKLYTYMHKTSHLS
jgi:hypothetical protein